MTEKFITTTELASILRVPAETVRYWRHADKGPKSFKIGRRVLYAESDVNDWINEQRAAQDDYDVLDSVAGPNIW